MIPNLCLGNGCFTKHPFKNGCLEYQVQVNDNVDRIWQNNSPTHMPLVEVRFPENAPHGKYVRWDKTYISGVAPGSQAHLTEVLNSSLVLLTNRPCERLGSRENSVKSLPSLGRPSLSASAWKVRKTPCQASPLPRARLRASVDDSWSELAEWQKHRWGESNHFSLDRSFSISLEEFRFLRSRRWKTPSIRLTIRHATSILSAISILMNLRLIQPYVQPHAPTRGDGKGSLGYQL